MYPDWTNPPKFSPEALDWILNTWGTTEWELIHMQPVAELGSNGDILFQGGESVYAYKWSNDYFAVFKRRRSDDTVIMRFKRPKS